MKRRKGNKILLLGMLLAFHHSEATEIFSTFNRYDLSYSVLEKQRRMMVDTGTVGWFSLPALDSSDQKKSAFSVATGSQKIDADIGAIAALEYFSKSNRFGVITGDVGYYSHFLCAFISADVYSTERRAVSPVADIQFERFIKENAKEPIVGMFDFRANISDAYLLATYRSFSVSTGKRKIRWGPGYKGTLGLSGTAYSPFYFYHMNLAFGRMLNATAFLCGYDDETIYRKELLLSEKITVKNNNLNLKTFLPRYSAGQRFDLRIGHHLQIGLYELVDFFGSNELNRFANPLQFYYLSNESSGTNNANLMGGLDFNIIFKPFRLYGDFLNDDITVFEKTGNPNKYGVQLGAAWYSGSAILKVTGCEYTHVSPYIYGHSRVLSRHSHWEESVGWPWGNDQDVVTAYGVFDVLRNLTGKAEFSFRMKGDGTVESDWYADGKPDLDNAPYFPDNADKSYSLMLSGEYTPFPWMTCSFFWEPVVAENDFSSGGAGYIQVQLPGGWKTP